MEEVTAAVKSVKSDTEDLATSITENAAAIEEMGRSIKTVSCNSEDLATAAEAGEG